jgi:MFS family permease
VTQLQDQPVGTSLAPRARRLPHRAWIVAVVAFITLIGAAGFRAVPSVLIDPLHDEFGWSRATISSAVSINLVLFGLFSPFAAALMDRLGMRRVVVGALIMVAAGSGLTVFMTASWQLLLCWGVLVGLGTGSMAMTFVATVTSRWFVKHRGLVSGILTAAGATGQLIFLPLVAALATEHGWRTPALVVSAAALAVVPLVVFALRDYPADVGTTAYGATGAESGQPVGPVAGGAVARTLRTLRDASRTSTFWLLAGGFAICGMSTNGLIGTHFVAAAHDHGMPHTTAASLLAVVGIFDVGGTILSGWLTDRVDPRVLLGGYYTLRGLSLLILPALFAPETQPSMWVFIIFYGLDWIATVPPTVALCRNRWGMTGPIVFGWVFASHQLGAAIAAVGAGAIRDGLGDYQLAFYLAGGLCVLAALFSISIRTVSPAKPVTPR